MTDDEYRPVDAHQHTLLRYPCGVAAGDRLRLRDDLYIEDHLGTRTGEVLQAGSIWKVLPGVPTEPLVIWLEDPRGELHTWDDESVRVDFQAIDAA